MGEFHPALEVAMSTGAIVGIVIAVLAVAAATVLAMIEMRRHALRQRFGPEYERLAREIGPRQAEAELASRRRRVAEFEIRALTPAERTRYAVQWNSAQERFVDNPAAAVEAGGALVAGVLRDRGYPAADRKQSLADLSVEYAGEVGGYRQALETMDAADASTDELRRAMLQYRALFSALLGPADDDPVRVYGSQAVRPGNGRSNGGRPAAGRPVIGRLISGRDTTATTANASGKE
jgi:hypothetical protein